MKKRKVKVAKTEKVQDLLDVSKISGLKVIPIQTRKFIEYNFDFTTSKLIELPKINMEDIRDAVVKVSIRIRQEDAGKIDYQSLENSLKEYAYIVRPIIPVIQKERKVRMQQLTIDLNPIEAVRVWLSDKKVKNAEQIFTKAEQIIREVGTDAT